MHCDKVLSSQSLLTLWLADSATWYSSGYLYTPFSLAPKDQSYLNRYFSE